MLTLDLWTITRVSDLTELDLELSMSVFLRPPSQVILIASQGWKQLEYTYKESVNLKGICLPSLPMHYIQCWFDTVWKGERRVAKKDSWLSYLFAARGLFLSVCFVIIQIWWGQQIRRWLSWKRWFVIHSSQEERACHDNVGQHKKVPGSVRSRVSKVKPGQELYCGCCWKGKGKGWSKVVRLRLVSLNNFSRLYGMGVSIVDWYLILRWLEQLDSGPECEGW